MNNIINLCKKCKSIKPTSKRTICTKCKANLEKNINDIKSKIKKSLIVTSK